MEHLHQSKWYNVQHPTGNQKQIWPLGKAPEGPVMGSQQITSSGDLIEPTGTTLYPKNQAEMLIQHAVKMWDFIERNVDDPFMLYRDPWVKWRDAGDQIFDRNRPTTYINNLPIAQDADDPYMYLFGRPRPNEQGIPGAPMTIAPPIGGAAPFGGVWQAGPTRRAAKALATSMTRSTAGSAMA